MGYLGATLTQVFTRARGADVSLRDVTTVQDGKRGYRVQMTSRTRSARKIWGDFEKVSGVETRHRMRRVDFRLLAKALGRCRTRWGWGGRWKGQHRKIVPLSPNVEKLLNSKVIKSFVPEQRSRKSFPCFEIPMFYVIYIWTSHVHFAYSCIWLWYSYRWKIVIPS